MFLKHSFITFWIVCYYIFWFVSDSANLGNLFLFFGWDRAKGLKLLFIFSKDQFLVLVFYHFLFYLLWLLLAISWISWFVLVFPSRTAPLSHFFVLPDFSFSFIVTQFLFLKAFFFPLSFLFSLLFFHTVHPDHTHFPFLPGPSSTPSPHNTPSPISVAHIFIGAW